MFMRNAKTILLILTTLAFTTFQAYALTYQIKGKILFSGVLFDKKFGNELAGEIYIKKNSEWIKIGATIYKSSMDSKYSVFLTTDMQAISIRSKGYKTIEIPLYFQGRFEKDSAVSFDFSMEKEDNNNQQSYIAFCKNDNSYSSSTYIETHFIDDEVHCTKNMTAIVKNGFMYPFLHGSGESGLNNSYKILVATAPEGKTLMENKYVPKKGLNFIDTNIYPLQENIINPNLSPEVSLSNNMEVLEIPSDSAEKFTNTPKMVTENMVDISSISPLTFEQSKYDLSLVSQESLNKLVDYMIAHENQKIRITGYAENIGDPKRNETLAEYRTKAVLNYLRNKGLKENRFEIKWESAIQIMKKRVQAEKKESKVLIEDI